MQTFQSPRLSLEKRVPKLTIVTISELPHFLFFRRDFFFLLFWHNFLTTILIQSLLKVTKLKKTVKVGFQVIIINITSLTYTWAILLAAHPLAKTIQASPHKTGLTIAKKKLSRPVLRNYPGHQQYYQHKYYNLMNDVDLNWNNLK